MSRAAFNEAYLNAAYPDELLQNVILGKPIYGAKGLQKNAEGFSQHLKSQSVDILYRVNVQEIYFKDKTNKILIKIKEIK